MLDALKHFVTRLAYGPEARAFDEDDERLAAAVLLVHVASADGLFDAEERALAQRRLETLFSLSPDAAAELIAEATAAEGEAVDVSDYAHLLNRKMDEAARRRVLAVMRQAADGDAPMVEVEQAALSRMAELLGFPGDEWRAPG